MTDQPDDALQRLQTLIQHAVDGLDPIDREYRARWCNHTGQHGVICHFNADTLVFVWGGSKLAEIDRAVLFDNAPYEAVLMTEHDTVPPEWLDG